MAYNIIFYFSDQQRWDTCGCFGQPLNITPNPVSYTHLTLPTIAYV